MPNYLSDTAAFTDADLQVFDWVSGQIPQVDGQHFELHHRIAEALKYLRVFGPALGELGRSAVPMLVAASGTMGDNGALTLGTALARAYPHSYVYLPADAIESGSAAGWYYTEFSTTTAGVVYNNTYTSGSPRPPASPVAFDTTGPGSYTGVTTEHGVTISVPGNLVGPWGDIEVETLWSNTNSAGAKTGRVRLGGASGSIMAGLAVTAVATLRHNCLIRAAGSQSSQFSSHSSTSAFGTSSLNPITASVDLASDSEIVLTCQKVVATDNLALEGFRVVVRPSW